MTLVSCKECSTQVSSAAPVCPKCGAPLDASTTPSRKFTLLGLLGGLLVGLALGFGTFGGKGYLGGFLAFAIAILLGGFGALVGGQLGRRS